MRKKESSTCSRRRFIRNAGLTGATLTALSRRVLPSDHAVNKPPSKPPNLILFVTDDQRWDCIGRLGNSIIETPTLDRLAEEGVSFTNNFCATSICMTSRATIFTGLYSRCHTINDFRQPLSDSLFQMTYPMLLHRAGYRTGFVGKWGLGGDLPVNQFDFFEGFSGQGKYFHEIDGKPVHLTRIMAQNAMRFIRSGSGDQPFCLSVSFKAPHVKDGDPNPFQYDPAFESWYQDVHIPPPTTATSHDFDLLPQFIRESEGRVRWKTRFSTPELFQKSVKGYYRLISGVDEAVGRIMSLLETLSLLDNTVILFTSDNGFFLGEHGLAGKWFMYEESIRTPLIIRDPRLPETKRGAQRREMTLNVDLAPTLLALAGTDIPPSMQGRSLIPLLTGKPIPWRKEWFYDHLFVHKRIPKSEGIRTERWKYIRYIDQRPVAEELYDLKSDPLEQRDLIDVPGHRSLLDRMRGRRETWIRSFDTWSQEPTTPWKEPD